MGRGLECLAASGLGGVLRILVLPVQATAARAYSLFPPRCPPPCFCLPSPLLLPRRYVGDDVSPDFYGWVFPKYDHVAVGTGTVVNKTAIKQYQQATRDRAKVKTEGGQIIRVEAHPIPGERACWEGRGGVWGRGGWVGGWGVG